MFPDTSVLYPISLLDLIMRLAEVGAHTVVWSDDLLAELEQKWIEGRAAGKRVMNERGAASALAGIRRTFQASLVPRSAYEARIGVMPGDGDADKPHPPAAEAGGATHIVTPYRAGGFPVAALSELGIQVQSPDECLVELADEFPEDCVNVVEQMVERRQQRDPDVTRPRRRSPAGAATPPVAAVPDRCGNPAGADPWGGPQFGASDGGVEP